MYETKTRNFEKPIPTDPAPEALFRSGRYPIKPSLPCFVGYEASGVVEAMQAREGLGNTAIANAAARQAMIERRVIVKCGVIVEREIVVVE